MEGKNELIVGLDVGSNSVGWAVIQGQKDKDGVFRLEQLHGMGSRIIPASDDTRNFEQGKAQAKNALRRQKRSMRRNNQRYKLRRANLVKVLKLIGAWPDGLGETAKPGQVMLSPLELYGLRAKAVEQPLSDLKALGRVLYHMNQRRGYKDIGDLMNELKGEESADPEKESAVTREVHKVLVKDVVLEDGKGKKELYLVTLADGRSGLTKSRSFLDLVGKEEYVEVKTRETKKGTTIEFYRTSVSDWLKDKDNLDRKLDESGLHPGQYFHREFQANPLNRVRERIVLRERFRSEFDAIWKRQAEAFPQLREASLRDTVVTALIPNNLALRQQWAGRELGSIIRDFVIYHQRPLKSQAKNKGECRFERKPVMPVSSPLYQLFRIWQQVNNIKLRDKYMKEMPLSSTERTILVEHLLEHAELKPEQVLKELGRKNEVLDTNLRAALPGHVTLGKLRKSLRKEPVWQELLTDAAKLTNVADTKLFKLWHVLYSVPEEELRKTAVIKLLSCSDELAGTMAKVRFERKHGAVSARAAARILPFMVCGEAWSVDNIPARDQRRVQRIIDTGGTDDMKEEMKQALARLSSLEHFQGLPYWMASTVVYGDHRAKTGKMFNAPEDIRPAPRGFLRNPVVEQVLNETMMVVRDIWKTYGKPTSFRVELARELRQNMEQRKKSHDNNQNRDRERKKVMDVLSAEFKKAKPSRKDIEKYELWAQQKHRCVYCGQGIEATDLFNTREVDIDHIIPRSLFYDDSIQNRVLVHRSENAGAEGKNKMLGAQYMRSLGPDAYEHYVDRIKEWNFSPGKRRYLLAEEVPDSFINRQLNETRYIGTAVRELLQQVAPVDTTLGMVTNELKNEWGLDKVFKEINLPRFERLEGIVGRKLIEEIPLKNGAGHKDWRIEGYDKRIDHRHHALDALVVALTQQKYIQRLTNLKQARLSEGDEQCAKKPTWWPLPHPKLREMVKDQLERTIPSIKNRKRLLTKATNSTLRLVDPATGKTRPQKQTKGTLYAVRGALHDEQPMGEVRMQERTPLKKVLERLAQVMDKEGALHVLRPLDKADAGYRTRLMAHDHERALLFTHLAKYEGSIEQMKKALKKDPLLNSDGEEVLEMTLLVPRYTSTKVLSPTFSGSMAKGIIDRDVRKRVEAHLKAYGDDAKKAFEGDGLFRLNDGKGQRITKVRYVVDDVLVGEAKGRIAPMRKADPNAKLFVEKGENFALVVYVHQSTGERSFDVVPFYDAVQRKLKGLEIAEPKVGCKSFLLKKGDLVYVPRPNENLIEVDWTDGRRIGERLMRMTKASGEYVYFIPSRATSAINLPTSKMEFGTQSATEFEDRDEPRTKIKNVCVPVQVDRLGKVTPLFL